MSTLDTLRHFEATVRAQRMSREDKRRYLRDHGWRRIRPGGTQLWQDSEGKSATPAGATVIQLQRDLSAD
jgi:hypothetical protein